MSIQRTASYVPIAIMQGTSDAKMAFAKPPPPAAELPGPVASAADPDANQPLAAKQPSKRTEGRASRRLAKRSPTADESLEETITKFTVEYRRSHAGALAEIQRGQKRSCWSWWIWPTNYRSGASGMSLTYALSDEQATAFMHDAYLRGCWLQMMTAVAEQVESGVTMRKLCGVDVPRVPATCELMKRVVGGDDEQVATVCARVTAAIKLDASRKKKRKAGSNTLKSATATRGQSGIGTFLQPKTTTSGGAAI